MSLPVVLHLSNEASVGPTLGFGSDFGELEVESLLHYVPVTPMEFLPRGLSRALQEVSRRAVEAKPDVIFVQSPHGFPWTEKSVARLLRQVGHPPVIYWEGDGWGGRRTLPEGSRAWLRHADTVFSVALGPQAQLLGSHSRHPVRYVCSVMSTWLQVSGPVTPIEEAEHDVMHIGGCYTRLGFFACIDGALERRRLVRRLSREHGRRLAVYGPGWRGPSARGRLAYSEQIRTLRRSRLSANWQHFPHYPGYFSDRLPISLYAGRPHISSRPPGVTWLPGPDQGLHLVNSVDEAVSRVRDLLRTDPAELHAAGLAAHHWVRSRLTSRNALRYMLGDYLPVPPPPADPWQAIAAMDGLVSARGHVRTASTG
ncbi:glycosyltransferase family protein [Streptomyces sp. CA-142005]|uniref:glycosyltransferase family protein n=1 Tax=Streptomyces sp. CA-142005 TaxID=3240052 RepID=UPI003D91CAED